MGRMTDGRPEPLPLCRRADRADLATVAPHPRVWSVVPLAKARRGVNNHCFGGLDGVSSDVDCIAACGLQVVNVGAPHVEALTSAGVGVDLELEGVVAGLA